MVSWSYVLVQWRCVFTILVHPWAPYCFKLGLNLFLTLKCFQLKDPSFVGRGKVLFARVTPRENCILLLNCSFRPTFLENHVASLYNNPPDISAIWNYTVHIVPVGLLTFICVLWGSRNKRMHHEKWKPQMYHQSFKRHISASFLFHPVYLLTSFHFGLPPSFWPYFLVFSLPTVTTAFFPAPNNSNPFYGPPLQYSSTQ